MFYDSNLNLTKQLSFIISNKSEPKTIQTKWKYNCMNSVSTLVEAANSKDEKVTSYTYTPRKELYQTIKPDGVILTNTYNDLSQHIKLTSSDNTINYSFSYNKLNHLVKSLDNLSNTQIERKVDRNGNILQEVLPNGYKIINKYDSAGRKVQQTLPGGSQIEYQFQAFNLKKITKKDPFSNIQYEHSFLKYDFSGNLLKEEMICDLGETTYDICPLNKPKSIESYSSLNNNYSKKYYFQQTVDTFDLDEKIKKMSYSSDLGNDTSEFFYDDLKQLTKETGLFDNSYKFDSNKNRIQKNDTQYLINDLNQITSTSKSKYLYDKNGNPIQKQTSNGDIYYQYDALDRLITIEKPKEYKLEFTYDSQNRRISKTYFEHSVSYSLSHYWSKKYSEEFIYDNQNEIGCFSDDKLTHLRVLKDSDQAEIGASIAIEINGDIFAPIHDLQGNVTMLISSKNRYPQEFYRYSAFGEEKIYGSWRFQRTNSYLNNPWRFSSKRTDSETSLVYYGRRYYDPQIGRWLTPDPKGFVDGLNLYAFVNNDPLIYLDLYGLFIFDPHPLSFNVIHNFNYRSDNYTQTINLGLPERDPYKKVIFSNGIKNSKQEALSHSYYLSKSNNDCNINTIYNEDLGLVKSLPRAGSSIFWRTQSSASKLLQKECENYLDMNKKNEILLFAHSEGAANSRNALLAMDQKYRERINFVGIAPAAFVPRGICKSTWHYVCTNDIVPKIDRNGLKKSIDTITFLSPNSKDNISSHCFQNSIYQDHIEYHLDKFFSQED